MPMLRMSGALPPVPYIPSWHGAWAEGQHYLYLTWYMRAMLQSKNKSKKECDVLITEFSKQWHLKKFNQSI